MTGAVHACIGAALGSLTNDESAAFAAGVISHVIADACPHNDCSPAVEAPLVLGALAGIACWKGLDSPEFWGALGGVAPDLEHAFAYVGMMDPDKKAFPTHVDNGKWHGEKGEERWSQLILSAVSLALVALNSRE